MNNEILKKYVVIYEHFQIIFLIALKLKQYTLNL